mgnify:CR=1 FL=1
MSRITDLVDRAGGADDTSPAPAPRAVLATQAADADAAWQALNTGGTLSAAVLASPLAGLRRVYVPAGSASEDAAPDGLLGHYRGHPVHVPASAAGRILVHALRLLEEDPLSDMDADTRATHCAAALAHALHSEASQTPLDERLSLGAVNAFLAADPAQLAAALQLPESELSVPEALLILDTSVGGVALARGGLPLVLVRADRPALLMAAAGDDSASAFALLTLLVATCDLGAPLSSSLADLGPERPCVAMLLDERGDFQAAGNPHSAVHVRGYERTEAE